MDYNTLGGTRGPWDCVLGGAFGGAFGVTFDAS